MPEDKHTLCVKYDSDTRHSLLVVANAGRALAYWSSIRGGWIALSSERVVMLPLRNSDSSSRCRDTELRVGAMVRGVEIGGVCRRDTDCEAPLECIAQRCDLGAGRCGELEEVARIAPADWVERFSRGVDPDKPAAMRLCSFFSECNVNRDRYSCSARIVSPVKETLAALLQGDVFSSSLREEVLSLSLRNWCNRHAREVQAIWKRARAASVGGGAVLFASGRATGTLFVQWDRNANECEVVLHLEPIVAGFCDSDRGHGLSLSTCMRECYAARPRCYERCDAEYLADLRACRAPCRTEAVGRRSRCETECRSDDYACSTSCERATLAFSRYCRSLRFRPGGN